MVSVPNNTNGIDLWSHGSSGHTEEESDRGPDQETGREVKSDSPCTVFSDSLAGRIHAG